MVVRLGRRVHEQAGRFGPGGHLRELVGDGLELAKGAAEGLPRASMRQGGVERGLGHADRERPHTRTEQVQGSHGDPEPPVDLAQHGGRRDEHAVELEPPDRVRRHQLQRRARQAGTVPGHDECRHASGAGVGRRSAEQDVDVSLRGVRDPGLLAHQPVAVALGFGPGLDGAGVGAVFGLGEGERGDRLAPGDRRHPSPDQLRAPRLQDRIPAQALHGDGGFGLRGAVGQPLPQQAELQRRDHFGLPGSSGARREQSPQEPVVGQRGEKEPVHPPRRAARRDLRQRLVPQPARVVQQVALVVGEGEGHDRRISRVRRTR